MNHIEINKLIQTAKTKNGRDGQNSQLEVIFFTNVKFHSGKEKGQTALVFTIFTAINVVDFFLKST